MEINHHTEGNVLILMPEGHLDTAAAIAAERQVLQLIDDGAKLVLVDCSDLVYVNSSGLKVFLLAAKKLDSNGGRLAISSLAPNVHMIFEMIGFTKILTIVPDRQAGLAKLAESAAPA